MFKCVYIIYGILKGKIIDKVLYDIYSLVAYNFQT